MKKSIRLKLLAMFLFSLVAAVAVSFLLHYVFFRPYYLNHIERRLLDIYELVDENIHSRELQSILSDLDESHQVGIIVTDSNFSKVILSYNQATLTDQHLDRDIHSLITKEIETLQQGHIFVTVESREDIPPRKVFVKKLSDGGYCILFHPLEVLESSMDTVSEFHLMVMGIACVLGVMMTLFFSRKFTKPIIEIGKMTKAMSQLDFQQKIDYDCPDELGHLAKNINTLSEKLEDNRTALKNEIALQKVLTQNLSHELKTPIAVIKGYVEALTFGIADDQETRDEYMEIVLKECDRMNELIGQMLQLSKLSSYQGTVLEQQSFTAEEFVSLIQTQYQGILEQKKLPFAVEIKAKGQLWGQMELLGQAFGNFLTNAIKYGDGKELQMSVVEEIDCFTLGLYNSGTPIPLEECDKVFEVFYMLDKVRSRENNSHGLGLSVSKTIAELHQGYVFCQPMPEGNLFLLKLPHKQA